LWGGVVAKTKASHSPKFSAWAKYRGEPGQPLAPDRPPSRGRRTSWRIQRRIRNGTLDRYPGITICAAHGSALQRPPLGPCCKARPDLCHGGTWGLIKKRPTEYLR